MIIQQSGQKVLLQPRRLPYMMLLSFIAVGIISLFARPEIVILICINR